MTVQLQSPCAQASSALGSWGSSLYNLDLPIPHLTLFADGPLSRMLVFRRRQQPMRPFDTLHWQNLGRLDGGVGIGVNI